MEQIPWMETAIRMLGTEETEGTDNNPKIMAWAKVIGGDIETSYVADSIPWCGLFVSYCMADNGIPPVPGALYALNWSKFGQKLSAPCYGCVLVFRRTGGGHVGFYLSEDADYYHVLGGNQSDKVCVTKVSKLQFVSANWPKGFDKFMVPGRISKRYDGKIATKLV